MNQEEFAKMTPEQKKEYEQFIALRKKFAKPSKKKYVNDDHKLLRESIDSIALKAAPEIATINEIGKKIGVHADVRISILGLRQMMSKWTGKKYAKGGNPNLSNK